MIKLKAKIIDHVQLSVSDIERSIKFYTTLFDFEIYKYNKPHKSFAVIGNQDLKLCLHNRPDIDYYDTGTIVHFGLEIENWDDVLDKLAKMDISHVPPFTWEDGAESIYITDPDLTEIELVKIRGAGLKVQDEDFDPFKGLSV